MRELPVRAARWSALHPWRAIAGWLAFVVLCLGVGIAVGTNSATTEDYRVGEAGRAEAMAAEGHLERRPTEQVLISARAGALDRAAADAAARDVAARMAKLPEVEKAAAPRAAKDGRALVVEVTMKGSELDAQKHVDPLREQTEAVQRGNPRLLVEETGHPSVSKGVDGQRDSDLALSEKITLPVTLITLFIAFGSLITALVPVLLALSSIAAAMGLSMIASHVSPDAGVGNNVILLIGLAVGVDYTLFYLKREREERERSGGRIGPEALVELAAATSGRAVVVAGLAVVVSTATLYLASDVIFSSLATGTVLVVLVAVASSLTVLPALLVTIGQRAQRRAARRARPSRRPRKSGTGRVWAVLMRPASKHPAITLVVSTLAMLALAAPVAGLKLTEMSQDTHSRAIPAMRTYDRLNEAFPELRVTHQVVVRAAAGRAGEVADSLRELGRRARADRLFTGEPRLRTSADHRISVLSLSVPHLGNSDEARESLAHLRDDYVPGTVGRIPGAETGVTGDVARYADYPAHQRDKLPLVIGALLAVTFVMTLLAFRSVVLGLVGVVLNLLSAAAALGLLVLVFQGEWAEGLLDFHSTGTIGSRVPLFLFVILFGLSMDYQVFVVSRIREAALRGVPTRKAVLDGIGSSASVVTSAAVVMVTVFASFVFLHLIEMKQIGFVLAAAVLLDAFIIRIMILPSVMLLLGKASWWPSRGMRRAQEAPPRGGAAAVVPVGPPIDVR
ncbi:MULTISPECIES: MMPL family transporter [Streptomyces]|uniref:MMPL family transporter n=1 Tax=Streptomyces TaxID=1883 RepID=UPI00163B62A3|nr:MULTISPECIES: MMPL family transporter [Streptomyces]MBC2877833.1 MMPL family transporter [Streptomyces sp. TYQ1024]UBI37971.1 MMPL family transporter [Streptomyces mobaraensis]UKW30559.1 MMPL family transporter [Streptomyces sp. TYQ1024]